MAMPVKLRAMALSEISQMLNETLPWRVQRNFACLRLAQRLHLPHKSPIYRAKRQYQVSKLIRTRNPLHAGARRGYQKVQLVNSGY